MLMTGFNRLALRLLVAAILVYSSNGRTEPSAAQKETARAFMAEGRQKRQENDLPGALFSFQRAHDIMAVPTTGMEVARTMVQLGMLRDAKKMATQVAASPVQPKELPPFAHAREEAEKLQHDLEKQVPTVTVHVKGLEGREIPHLKLNGTSLPQNAFNTAIPLDPGIHNLLVTVGIRFEKLYTVTLHEGDQVVLDVAVPRTSAPISQPAKPTKVSSSPQYRWTGPVPVASFVVAGAGILLGSATGWIAITKGNKAKEGCTNNLCPPPTHDDIQTGTAMATVSTISFAVASSAALTGIGYVLLTPHNNREPRSQSYTASPWVGLGTAGIQGNF